MPRGGWAKRGLLAGLFPDISVFLSKTTLFLYWFSLFKFCFREGSAKATGSLEITSGRGSFFMYFSLKSRIYSEMSLCLLQLPLFSPI